MVDVAELDLAPEERLEIRRQARLVLPGVMLVMFLASLDMQIINTALPSIASDLGGLSHLSWVATSFIVAAAAATPLYGKLGDMYGRKPILIGALVVFLVASLLCAISTTMIQLAVFRGLQGAGAGGLMALSQTVIADIIPPRERGRYQGLFTGVMAIASVSGPLVGGLLTSALDWRWVFLINLPLGLGALAMLWFNLKIHHVRHAHHVDYFGAALLTGATISVLLGLTWVGGGARWDSPLIVGMFAATVCFASLFIWFEPRAPEPIINLGLFRNPVFTIGVASNFAMAAGLSSALVFLPLYFQLVLGRTPAESGMMILPQIIGMLLSSTVGGHLVSNSGKVKPFLLGGAAMQAGSLAVIAIAALSGFAPWVFMAAIGAFGLGMGLSMPMLRLAIQNTVMKREVGVATSTQQYIHSVGSSIGVTIGGALMAFQLVRLLQQKAPSLDPRGITEHGMAAAANAAPAVQAAAAEAYRLSIASAYVVSAAVMSLALLLAFLMPSEILRARQD